MKSLSVICGIGAVTLMLLAIPGKASAFTSGYAYICSMYYYPQSNNPTYGDHGRLMVTFHSSPGCHGTNLGTGIYFSTGATHTDANTSYLHSMMGLAMLHNALQLALIHNQKVYAQNCGSARPNCINRIVFNAVDSGTSRSSDTLHSPSTSTSTQK